MPGAAVIERCIYQPGVPVAQLPEAAKTHPVCADAGRVRGGAGAVADHGVARQVHLPPGGRERGPYRAGRRVRARFPRAARRAGCASSPRREHHWLLPRLGGLTSH